jgi:hypothetical protein
MTRQCLDTRTMARWGLLLLLLAGVGGCSRTAKVTGKVSYQGRPVTYGSVIFVDGTKAARSCAIGADGSYAVEGVTPGNVEIGVISRDPSKGRSAVHGRKLAQTDKKGAGSSGTATGGWFPLPAKLENPETSDITCTVGSGRVTHDIDLK